MSYLTHEPLRPDDLIREIGRAEHGGTALFLGTVRSLQDGRPVRGIEYTAYEAMAEAVCRAIVVEAETRWPVRVALRHRLGELVVGDDAVAIAASGGHREEAFAACRYVIEEVKRRVPIWKRERFADGSEEWVEPRSIQSPAR
jgi:molybdopterin synthase catalytic subunit